MTATPSHHLHQERLRSALSVAEELGLPLYRLHSWESLYPVFATHQGEDGQSYYDAHAVEVVRHIARLLYQEGAKSHEIISRLRQDGVIKTEKPAASQRPSKEDSFQNHGLSRHDVTSLTERLKQLEEENKQLGEQLEAFGQIALSLKTLEDENELLRQKQEAAQSRDEHERQSYEASKRALEEDNAALHDTIEQLKRELAGHKAHMQVQESEHTAALVALREELARSRAECKSLRDAEQKRQTTHEAETRAGEERQTLLENERHRLVQKLEQSVLLMQTLEDENVRLKRSLKEGEAMRQEQVRLTERVQALESANATLKAERASLQQALSARDEEHYAVGQKQAGIQQFLQELQGELYQLKQLITE